MLNKTKIDKENVCQSCKDVKRQTNFPIFVAIK